MTKVGIVLGIIGILIGSGGLVIGYLAWENQTGLQAMIDNSEYQLASHKIWSVYYGNIFTPDELVYQTIPNMSLNIELNLPVSLYLIFTTSTRIIPTPGSFSDMLFYFILDDVRMTNPFTRAGSYQGTASYEYHSVCLTHFFEVMSPGTYNFSVSVISEYSPNFIRESTFTITSFPTN